MTLVGYSGVRRKLIHEKNLKAKISSQTPFSKTNKFTKKKSTAKKNACEQCCMNCLNEIYRQDV
jgi:hypothetical protein